MLELLGVLIIVAFFIDWGLKIGVFKNRKNTYFLISKEVHGIIKYHSGGNNWTQMWEGAIKYKKKPNFKWLNEEHEIIELIED